MGPRTGTRPPGTRGGGGLAAAARTKPGGEAGRGPGEESRERARGRRRTRASRARWRGRGGAAHVASRSARRRLLHPSLVELAPPWRARPLHKRPPRRRWRTPTWSDPPRAEEGAQCCRHSPPRLRRKSSPPFSTAAASADREQLRSPRNRTCCGPGPASQTSYWLRQPNPSCYWTRLSVTRRSPAQDSSLPPAYPSRLSLGAPRQPHPSRRRRAPGLVTELGEPAPGAQPPTPLSLEAHVGPTAWGPRPQ